MARMGLRKVRKGTSVGAKEEPLETLNMQHHRKIVSHCQFLSIQAGLATQSLWIEVVLILYLPLIRDPPFLDA